MDKPRKIIPTKVRKRANGQNPRDLGGGGGGGGGLEERLEIISRNGEKSPAGPQRTDSSGGIKSERVGVGLCEKQSLWLGKVGNIS